MGLLTWMLTLGNGDVGDTIRFLFGIVGIEAQNYLLGLESWPRALIDPMTNK